MNFFFFVGKIAIFCYLFATLKIVQKFFSAFEELQRREREREREREKMSYGGKECENRRCSEVGLRSSAIVCSHCLQFR